MIVPKKTIIQAVVVMVLSIFLAARFMNLKGAPQAGPSTLPADFKPFDAAAAMARIKPDAKPKEAPDAKAVSGRNPFLMPAEVTVLKKQPAAPMPDEPVNMVLEGVIWGSGKNLAVISGNVVAEGEVMSGATVSRIDADGVVLIKNGAEIKLKR